MTERDDLHEDDRIARLLRLAGPRAEAPPDVARRVKAAAMDQWRATVRARRRRRIALWTLAGAAAVAAAAAVLVAPGLRRGGEPLQAQPPAPAHRAGILIRAVGVVLGSAGDPVAPGGALAADTSIETSHDSLAAIGLDGGAVVRLARSTRVRIESASTISVERGTVYVDSGGGPGPDRRVTVRTPAAVVRDVGTQFEVHVEDHRIRVRVRRGAVVLEDERRSQDVLSGQQAVMEGGGGVSLSDVRLHGDPWAWTLEVAPPFRLEGRTLDEFLEWYSAETGLSVRFSDGTDARAAGRIVLHGSVEGIRPDRTPDVVLPTCGLTYVIAGDALQIGPEAGNLD